MNATEQLCDVINREYPHMNNKKISDMMGVDSSYVSKVFNGKLTGIKIAQWMAEHHEDCGQLHATIVRQRVEARKDAYSKRGSTAYTHHRMPPIDADDITALTLPVIHPQPETAA